MQIQFETNEDYEARQKKVIAALEESQLSEYTFNGEPFYLIGRGHDFVFGFYEEYITKSGIIGCQYGGHWVIGNKEFSYENNEFQKIERVIKEYNSNFGEITFPKIKKVFPKLLSDELYPTQPKKI